MFSIFKERDVLWRNFSSQSWDVPRKWQHVPRQVWQTVQSVKWNDRDGRLPTCYVNWVCDSSIKHHTWFRDADGTSVEAIFIQTTLSSKTPTPRFYDLPFRCARQRWHGECCAERQQRPAGAKATTLVTGSLAPVTALLESISYTQHLSVGRTSAELLGAQESGRTA